MADILDLLLDETGDLLIENGDFVIDESTAQHMDLLLLSNKGEWRHSPSVGVGLRTFLNSPFGPVQRAGLQREIQIQLEADGAEINTLSIDATGEMELSAQYK